MTTRIELFLPGLVGVPGRLLEALAPEPTNAVLAQAMKRADSEAIPQGRYSPLAGWLGQSRAPLAALQAHAEGSNAPKGLMLATPTHVKAGMDDLVVMPPELLDIGDEERDRLARVLHEHFSNAPEFLARGETWFLQVGNVDITSVPLHDAVGRSMRPNLPRGNDATRVHAWMNEMQMALHAATVNQEREQEGRPAINGVWLWGEGDLPTEVPERLRDAAFCGHGLRLQLAQGLANWLHVDFVERLPREGNAFVVDTSVSDALDAEAFDEWRRRRDEAVSSWLEPALERLHDGSVDEIILYPGDGRRHRLTRAGRRRFWRNWRKTPPATIAESRDDEDMQ